MNSDCFDPHLLGSCTGTHSLQTSLLESSRQPGKAGHLFPHKRGGWSTRRPSCLGSGSKGQAVLSWRSSSGSLSSTCQAASHTQTTCSFSRENNLLSHSISLDACSGSVSRELPEPHTGFLIFKGRLWTCHDKALLALTDSWYFNGRNTALGLPLNCEYEISATRWLGHKPAQVLWVIFESGVGVPSHRGDRRDG